VRAVAAAQQRVGPNQMGRLTKHLLERDQDKLRRQRRGAGRCVAGGGVRHRRLEPTAHRGPRAAPAYLRAGAGGGDILALALAADRGPVI
jgi:hypothetical protein